MILACEGVGLVSAGARRNVFTSHIPINGHGIYAFMLGASLQCLIYLYRDASGYAVKLTKIIGSADVEAHEYLNGLTAFTCTKETDRVYNIHF